MLLAGGWSLYLVAIPVVISALCSTTLQHMDGLAVWGYSLSSRIVKVGHQKGGAHHGGGVPCQHLDLPYHLLVCSCDLYAYVGTALRLDRHKSACRFRLCDH